MHIHVHVHVATCNKNTLGRLTCPPHRSRSRNSQTALTYQEVPELPAEGVEADVAQTGPHIQALNGEKGMAISIYTV